MMLRHARKILVALFLAGFTSSANADLLDFYIDDLRLVPSRDNVTTVTAVIEGSFDNSCREISNVSVGPPLYDNQLIKIYVDSRHSYSPDCQDQTIPIREKIDLGYLIHGYYTIEVYQDGELVIAKEFDIGPDFYNGRSRYDMWPDPNSVG